VPEPGAFAPNVAVNDMDWPNVDGLVEEVIDVIVPSLLTVCVNADDVLVAKLASPPYTAVMLWLPLERVEVENVATPAPFSVPMPSVVAPSLKVTVPVGLPEPGDTAKIVAVKETDWPKTEGLAEDVRDVVLAAALTVCVKVPVLIWKLLSPEYTAVIV